MKKHLPQWLYFFFSPLVGLFVLAVSGLGSYALGYKEVIVLFPYPYLFAVGLWDIRSTKSDWVLIISLLPIVLVLLGIFFPDFIIARDTENLINAIFVLADLIIFTDIITRKLSHQ